MANWQGLSANAWAIAWSRYAVRFEMLEIKRWWKRAAAVALALGWGTACQSDDSASEPAGADATAETSGGASGAAGAGSGGTSGAGGAVECDGSAGVAGLGEHGCPAVYNLPHYDGDKCDLCDPGQSIQCPLAGGYDWVGAFRGEFQCVPDGSACAKFPKIRLGADNECGWNGVPLCPELTEATKNATGAAHPCASDKDCVAGHYCNIRVDNRMFCEGAVFVYAKDYCADAGADAGSDASDASP